jgi:hypothetical protein
MRTVTLLRRNKVDPVMSLRPEGQSFAVTSNGAPHIRAGAAQKADMWQWAYDNCSAVHVYCGVAVAVTDFEIELLEFNGERDLV